MMYNTGVPFLGFLIWLVLIIAFWYIGVLILRWALGTQTMIDELKRQNATLTEILNEIRNKHQ